MREQWAFAGDREDVEAGCNEGALPCMTVLEGGKMSKECHAILGKLPVHDSSLLLWQLFLWMHSPESQCIDGFFRNDVGGDGHNARAVEATEGGCTRELVWVFLRLCHCSCVRFQPSVPGFFGRVASG